MGRVLPPGCLIRGGVAFLCQGRENEWWWRRRSNPVPVSDLNQEVDTADGAKTGRHQGMVPGASAGVTGARQSAGGTSVVSRRCGDPGLEGADGQ